MRVLGIDPGLRITGYGCIEGEPLRPAVVEAGVIRLVGGAGPAPPVADRLLELERDLVDLLDRVRPEVVAVESVFTNARFPGAAIVMAHARGVVLLATRRAGLELVELAPRSVKQAMTGSGRATKEQMQLAVQGLFSLPSLPTPADVADALAIAVTAGARGRTILPR